MTLTPTQVRLDLTRNLLTALPADMGACASLVELCAGENRLTSLPPSVGTLSALRTLDLRCVLYRAA